MEYVDARDSAAVGLTIFRYGPCRWAFGKRFEKEPIELEKKLWIGNNGESCLINGLARPMAYKYRELKEIIREQILSGALKDGDKISSEQELSRRYHVSRQTVRGALAELVKDGLVYTIQAKGSFVRGVSSPLPKTGVLGFGTELFKSYNIFPNIITGINETISTQQYNIIISETQNTLDGERKCLESFLAKRVDGVIIEPCKSALPCVNLDLYDELIRRGVPIVFFNAAHSELSCSSVVADDEAAGYMAAKCMMDFGHRDLCAFFKYDDRQGHNRFKGTIRALGEKGIRLREDRVIWLSTEDYEYFWDLEGRKDHRFDQRLLDFARTCTGMIAYNDVIAAKVLSFYKSQGIKVPDDFSLISFDDTDLTKPFGVGVTSITHPSYEMGRRIGSSMIEMLSNPRKKIDVLLPCELIVRESVGNPALRSLTKA